MCEESDTNSEISSDIEADQSLRGSHTVVFKVIGCTKESRYQLLLVWARQRLEDSHPVEVHLKPEPSNPYDPNAVAFCCLKDGKLERFGYVVKEAAKEVCDALRGNQITSISFHWIKYITDWSRSGPGYFSAVKVTKLGKWSSAVLKCASTR